MERAGKDINGFNLEEALTLSEGLKGVTSNPQLVIEKILDWTNGQPFLTQKICQLVSSNVSQISIGSEMDVISDLVKSKFICDWEAQDEPPHLTTIRNAIIADKQCIQRVIGLYLKIKTSRYGLEPEDSQEEWLLRLTGLITCDAGKLVVSHQIYKKVFNKNWAKKELVKYQPFIEDVIEWLGTQCQDNSFLLKGESLQSALNEIENQSINDDSYKVLITSLNFENKRLKKVVYSQKSIDKSIKSDTVQENVEYSNSQYIKAKSGAYQIKKQATEVEM